MIANQYWMVHRFEPYLKKGEISNLPAFSFYVRIKARESIEPLSGVTVVLPEDEADETVPGEGVKASRETYGREYVKPKQAEDSSGAGSAGTDMDESDEKSKYNEAKPDFHTEGDK